ncbi:MAG: glycosyltransferase family 39 protein [Chloroflexi bacterium]|nr:glycosyltransferase family 39 protein [Chloroflexota bacterium]
MKTIGNIIDKTWEKLLVLFGALCVLLPASPLNLPLPYKDSGVFLYMGWRILNGGLPYRDIWDHKPPVIFYINALGLFITNNSRWGVWLLELSSLFFAALIGFQLIKKAFGIFPAIFSLLLWLLSLVPILQGGNFTTEYTLPLQFFALWLVYDSDQPDGWRFFLIGLTGAIAFFTKQTAVGIWIAIAISLLLRKLTLAQIRQWFRELSLISFGGLTVFIIILIFFGAQGAFPQFWSAAFKYNYFYSSLDEYDMASRLSSATSGLRPLTRAGLLQFSIIGYAIAIGHLLFNKKLTDKFRSLLLVGLIDLPVELALIGISKNTFPHYYMTLLPVLALLTGFTAWAFVFLISTWKIPNIVKYVAALGLLAVFAQGSFDNYMDQLYTYRKFNKKEAVINYIKEATSPDDYVLMWGAETFVNYETLRKSPSRFSYQHPLRREGYVDERLIIEFLDDVIQHRPQLIINTLSPTPMYDFPIRTAEIDTKISYLQSHYCTAKDIDSWTVYEYSEDICVP